MSKHTPGPWLYRPYQHDDWGFVRCTQEVDGFYPLVACARSGGYPTEKELAEHRGNGTDPYEANGRLIAAAPELLEALKDMLDWADTPSQEASPSWIIGACRRARAAIAKAEGKPE